MTRRSERLAAILADPTLRAGDDLARLADLTRPLSALNLAGPNPRSAASTRAYLVASAAARGEPEPEPSARAARSRIRLCIAAAVAAAAVAGVGVAAASDAVVDVPRPPRTFGPVAPAGAPTSVGAPGGGTGSTSQSASAGSGGDRSATVGPSASGSAAPAVPAPSASPSPPQLPDDVLACLKVLKLVELCI